MPRIAGERGPPVGSSAPSPSVAADEGVIPKNDLVREWRLYPELPFFALLVGSAYATRRGWSADGDGRRRCRRGARRRISSRSRTATSGRTAPTRAARGLGAGLGALPVFRRRDEQHRDAAPQAAATTRARSRGSSGPPTRPRRSRSTATTSPKRIRRSAIAPKPSAKASRRGRCGARYGARSMTLTTGETTGGARERAHPGRRRQKTQLQTMPSGPPSLPPSDPPLDAGRAHGASAGRRRHRPARRRCRTGPPDTSTCRAFGAAFGAALSGPLSEPTSRPCRPDTRHRIAAQWRRRMGRRTRTAPPSRRRPAAALGSAVLGSGRADEAGRTIAVALRRALPHATRSQGTGCCRSARWKFFRSCAQDGRSWTSQSWA